MLTRKVLQQFKEKADKSLKIETSFLIHDLTPVEKWLDEREFGKEYWRFEFIDRQKKIYQKDCIVNDEYFALLGKSDNIDSVNKFQMWMTTEARLSIIAKCTISLYLLSQSEFMNQDLPESLESSTSQLVTNSFTCVKKRRKRSEAHYTWKQEGSLPLELERHQPPK